MALLGHLPMSWINPYSPDVLNHDWSGPITHPIGEGVEHSGGQGNFLFVGLKVFKYALCSHYMYVHKDLFYFAYIKLYLNFIFHFSVTCLLVQCYI